MNYLDTEIRRWILLALRAQGGVLPEKSLAESIRAQFPRVAFAETEIRRHILDAEAHDLIAGSTDPVFGPSWGLTMLGANAAGQLR